MWGSEAVTSIGGGSGFQSCTVTAEFAPHHPCHLYAFHAPKTQIEKGCYLHLIIKSVLRTYIEIICDYEHVHPRQGLWQSLPHVPKVLSDDDKPVAVWNYLLIVPNSF